MNKLKNLQGKIFVVATPIGNLSDITFRAIETLKQIDFILAEDTRVTKHLLNHFGINKPIYALHDHNEEKVVATVLEKINAGKMVALVSDAGTPLISDPGYRLVAEAVKYGVTVVPIPGACAAITALSVAGFPTDRFVFEGFLPAKQNARKEYLKTLVNEPRTLIFYESPRRLLSVLADVSEIFGEREIVIARELTKLYEIIYRGNALQLIEQFNQNPDQLCGEIVILLRGAEGENSDEMHLLADKLLQSLVAVIPVKQATTIVADAMGLRKNDLYQRALAMVDKT